MDRRKYIGAIFRRMHGRLFSLEYLCIIAIVYALYLALAQLSEYLYLYSSPAVVLDPSGFSLAAVILTGYGTWPAILGAELTHGILNKSPVLPLIGRVIGNTLYPLAALFLLSRFNFDRGFFHVRDAFSFLGVVAATTLAAISVYSIFAALNGFTDTVNDSAWKYAWAGFLTSSCIGGSLMVRWINRPMPAHNMREYIERVCAITLLLVVSLVLYGTPYTTVFDLSLQYLLYVILFWIAFRMGPGWTTLGLFFMAAIAYVGAFARAEFIEIGVGNVLFEIQIQLVVTTVFFLLLASLEEQRKSAARSYTEHSRQLSDAIEKVRRDDAAKSDFIALLGHELRNPLAALLSVTELLAIDADDRSMRRIEAMKDRIHSMAHILDDILDVSRITQQKFTLHRNIVSIRVILRRSIEAARPLIESRGHRLNVSLPETSAVLDADATRLEQVITNLLNNAAKYTPNGGTIDLTLQCENDWCTIRVRDTGVGIAPDMLDKIFERFVQVNPKNNRSGGIGLGLALARALVEMHDGTIEAQSEGEGRGSEFIVRLPTVSLVKSPLQEEAYAL